MTDLVLKRKDTSSAGRLLGTDGGHKALLSHGKLAFISPTFGEPNYCKRRMKSRSRGRSESLTALPTENLLHYKEEEQ